MLDGKDRDDRLNGTSSTKQVAKLRFARTDGWCAGSLTKDRFDCGSLYRIAGRGTGGMGVDIVNVARL